MTFEAEYEKTTEAGRKKNFNFNVKDALVLLVKQTSIWFQQYGQQAAGDRQAVTRLTERVKELESRLFKLENKGHSA